MNDTSIQPSRRDLLQVTGAAAGVSVLAGLTLPNVYAGESNAIKVGLVGTGGRGTGAAANALQTKSGPIKLVAMADVFPHKLKNSTAIVGMSTNCTTTTTMGVLKTPIATPPTIGPMNPPRRNAPDILPVRPPLGSINDPMPMR